MVALLGTNVAEQRPVSMSIAVSTGVGYWFSTLWGMQSGFEWWVCCCFDVDGRLICLVSVCRWDTMICKACESSYVPWFLVLLVASALMLLLPWWPVDCPLHLPQVVPRMMVSLQSWLILSTVVSGCGSVVHSSSMRRGRLPSVWSIWCQLWRVVGCPWYHMDSLPKMSFSCPIVWCLVCWIWWWYVLARSWNVGWWLLWLFATMSCCWFRFFFLLCYCLCLLMLLHNLSWCCCFGHVASRCRCSLVGTMFLQSVLILRWSYSDPSSVDSHPLWWSFPFLVVWWWSFCNPQADLYWWGTQCWRVWRVLSSGACECSRCILGCSSSICRCCHCDVLDLMCPFALVLSWLVACLLLSRWPIVIHVEVVTASSWCRVVHPLVWRDSQMTLDLSWSIARSCWSQSLDVSVWWLIGWVVSHYKRRMESWCVVLVGWWSESICSHKPRCLFLWLSSGWVCLVASSDGVEMMFQTMVDRRGLLHHCLSWCFLLLLVVVRSVAM